MSSLLETHEEYIENKEGSQTVFQVSYPRSHLLTLGRLWTDVNFAQAVVQMIFIFLGVVQGESS